ncbi:hypothetical protein HKD37_05G014203 [Glycine soja]
MEESRAKPVCAEEALALLNCVTQSPYEEDKFLRLLHSLRHCVLVKCKVEWEVKSMACISHHRMLCSFCPFLTTLIIAVAWVYCMCFYLTMNTTSSILMGEHNPASA